MSTLRALVLVAVAAATFACSSPDEPPVDDDAETLREQVEQLTEANTDLAERLTSLEDDLSALRNLPDDDPLSDVTASLGGLVDRLDALDQQIDAEAAARREVAGDAESAASDLRSTVSDVRGTVESLQGEVDELRTLYETLRDRLDRQQAGD